MVTPTGVVRTVAFLSSATLLAGHSFTPDTEDDRYELGVVQTADSGTTGAYQRSYANTPRATPTAWTIAHAGSQQRREIQIRKTGNRTINLRGEPARTTSAQNMILVISSVANRDRGLA